MEFESGDDLLPPDRVRWKELLTDPTIVVCALILTGVGLVAVLAPLFVPEQATAVDLGRRHLPPVWAAEGTWDHPLGTDATGRDVLWMTVVASRASLFIGAVVVAVAGSFGTYMGMLAGLRGGWADQLITRAVDAQMAFPSILLAILLAGVFGPGVPVVILVLCMISWLLFARLARSTVFQLREGGFVAAAELVGCRQGRIMRKHLLPNIVGQIATLAMISFAVAVLLESAFTFLGLGLQPPTVSWGLMIAENQAYLATAWWSVVIPGVALAITVLMLNVLSASLRIKFDPHQQALARAAKARTALLRDDDAADNRDGNPAGASYILAEEHPSLKTPEASSKRLTRAVLQIEDLAVSFATESGPVEVVHDVSLAVQPGTTLGLVGESGSGKSLTAASVLGLFPAGGSQVRGQIVWKGEPLSRKRQAALRGSEITIINQEPVSTLDPLMTVGNQLCEVLRKHRGITRSAAEQRATELLDLVGIPEPGRRLGQYPWEFSGGMAQRVVIAMALAPEPELVIADEPTTAVDVTIQSQVLRVISDIQRELGLSMILITHDLGVVAGVADEIAVMYAGRIVESGPTATIFEEPRHHYTKGLMAATPNPRSPRFERLTTIRGVPPVRSDKTVGCAFAPRCDHATDKCVTTRPDLEPAADSGSKSSAITPGTGTHVHACWNPDSGQHERI